MTKLKSISKWAVEEIFIQTWRLDAVFKEIQNLSFEKCLEFGCDTGYFTSKMANISKQVIAVDKNKKALEYGKRTKKKSNIDWVAADMRHFLIEENSFDAISCMECLYYLEFKDRHSVMKSIIKGLKKEGYFLFSVPIKLPKEKQTWDESSYFNSKTEIEKFVKKYKLKIITKKIVITNNPFISSIKNYNLYTIIMKFYNFFNLKGGRNYFILAKKER